ncbi:hypothetical protein Goe16_01880 [Bacillus phage vB_BsuM-Goe16]|nr:hypothetical protein Goe16_01880 [Bacillus phage vB_BsuM-Goe16]
MEEVLYAGDVNIGKCDVCGVTAPLTRKCYHYDVKCECHSPNHFEVVEHCGDCTPRPPETTTVFMKPKEG